MRTHRRVPMRTLTVVATALAALLAIAVVPPALATGGDHDRSLDRALAATGAYNHVANAEADGYALPPEGQPLHECIAALDGKAAMGLHFINGRLVGDTVLDPALPEAVVYEPAADGNHRLVALEYVVFAEAWQQEHGDKPPRLFGRELTFVPEPNRFGIPAFYQIHAWLWRDNPDGLFADFNPRVSCG